MQGTPARVVSGILGHEQLSTLDHYGHYILEEGKKHQDRVFGESETACEDCEELRRKLARLRRRCKKLQAQIEKLEGQGE